MLMTGFSFANQVSVPYASFFILNKCIPKRTTIFLKWCH